MAIPKKTGTRSTAPAKEDEGEITNFTVGRSFTVSMGEFNSVKVSAMVSASTYALASEKVEEIIGIEAEKAGLQFNALVGGGEGDDDTGLEDPDAEDTAEADDEDAAEGGDDEPEVGPDEINAMKRPDILKLIKDNQLTTDPDDFPKTAKGLQALREAVIAEAFSDDVTEEQIMEMDRTELIAMIEENGLAIKPKTLPKLGDLRTAVVEAMAAEAGEEDAEPDDEPEEEADEAEADDNSEGYDAEQLGAMGIPDLKAIYTEWDLGKFPAGAPPVAKKLAIKAILAAQEG